ncbi:MAG TPA: glycosyl hydrolase [Candidatus Acidoferrum sp.]|nr:glycosyl hydrolase [Candidatus Acidoferrum sp.]
MRLITAAAIVILLAMIVIAALILPGTLKKSAPVSYKNVYGQQYCLNYAANVTAMKFAIASGVKCFRTDIYLNESYAAQIANYSSEGVQFLGVIDYNTVGAKITSSGCTQNCNWTLNTWNSSVENAIAMYPEIHQWEIWNEPLVTIFMDGYENGSSLNYFNMIKSAYTIIKKAEPNSTVICFGGADLLPSSDQEYDFYQSVWDYGASGYCDAISIHAYSIPYYNFSEQVGPSLTLYQAYNDSLNVYEGMTGKPIWITETGIPSNNWTGDGSSPSLIAPSQSSQSGFLIGSMEFFGSHSFVKSVYWFHLVGSISYGADYGLLNATTLMPKQAWYSFLSFVNANS